MREFKLPAALLVVLVVKLHEPIGLMAAAPAEIRHEVFEDGVEHWFWFPRTNVSPQFHSKFARVLRSSDPNNTWLPFERSIALVTGVSKYKHREALDSVTNDIVLMRDFLLKEACFDEVYVAAGDSVTRDLLELYVKGKLNDRISEQDRLLIYFSGHGANRGENGYLQFAGAKPNILYGQDVLPMQELSNWAVESKARHFLVLLDCCASGLAVLEERGDRAEQRYLATLAADPSRAIMTAGTGEGPAYGEMSGSLSNGIFTLAFVSAIREAPANAPRVVLTAPEVLSELQKRTAEYAVTSRKPMRPRLYEIQEKKYQGTFLFLNPNKASANLTAEESNLLRVKPPINGGVVSESCIVKVTSYIDGTVFIDGRDFGRIEAGQTRRYYDLRYGLIRIEVKTESGGVVSTIEVEKGKIGSVVIDPEIGSVTDASSWVADAAPAGLVLFQFNGYPAEVHSGTNHVGRLSRQNTIIARRVSAGVHDYSFRSEDGREIKSNVEVKPREIKVVLGPYPPPAPPTNLRVILH